MPDRTSNWSLRGRLVQISAMALTVSMLFGGLAMFWAATIEENQMLDSRLEHLGAVILSFVEEELEEELREVNDGIHSLPLQMKTRPSATLLYRYQVWTRHGSLAMRSHEASPTKPLMPLSRFGYDTVSIDGEEHRTFALPTRNGEMIVQVAENHEERWAQTGAITVYYMGFLVIPLGLVLAVTWLMFRHSLRSIESMADQLRDRTPHDLTPVHVDEPPLELLPILKAVDTLFARMSGALSVERRFTSVAAHEMRTPLAGLRAHAQLAATAQTPEDLNDALGAVMIGVDRASYLLEQLLDLARIEGLDHQLTRRDESADINAVYRSVMADLGPQASKRGLVFESHFQASRLACSEFGLHLLLSNLLGNAARHTPEGGRIAIRTAMASIGIELTIDDSGPGIPADSRHRAFERFNRLGARQTGGVGLGLSIVSAVVQSHRAAIELLDSPFGGLRVRILFSS